MVTTAPEKKGEDISLEKTLRPLDWEYYIGQESIKKNLKILIQAFH